MVVQSESNEKNKSLKLILHYLLLKDLVKPAWNWTYRIRQNEMLWAVSYTIPTGILCLNLILFSTLTLRLLQHATRVHNNNSMALIENTSFLHKHKHLKILKKASHCNLLEMRRKLKSWRWKSFLNSCLLSGTLHRGFQNPYFKVKNLSITLVFYTQGNRKPCQRNTPDDGRAYRGQNFLHLP